MTFDLKQALADLKGLHEEGLIDEEEFRRGKDALLSSAGMGSSPASSGTGASRNDSTGRGSRSKKTELTIDDEVSPFFPGTTLGPTDRPYKLGQRLGAGGMGQVWQALDVKESESLGREVWRVVKILPGPATSDPGQYKAVRQEAYLAEQLRHPHIVSVFGWREDHITGIPFIVMEWLQGKDLGRVLAEEGDPGLPFERVVELLDPVIEALDYAWKKHQLIHRDLKPANIFVTEGGEIKLLDFGIAARIGKTGSSINLKGREQAGTPGYRPPEAKAKRTPAPTWDVYGLGALTYELLTGSAPFDEDRAPYTPAPDAPENLNEAQWEVLQRAFAFDESKRIAGVMEFWQAIQAAKSPIVEQLPRAKVDQDIGSALRGTDLRIDLEISLEDAVRGTEERIQFPTMAACKSCGGNDASRPTPDSCPTCQGLGLIKQQVTLSIKVPPGVDTGDRIRLSGQGEDSVSGGAPGDLYVQIHLKEHAVFQRHHDDLHCEMPVSFGAAALGSEIEIPTLDGVARLKVPAETQTGKVFRLRGKGIKAVRSVSHGDLLCHIVVETPTHLTQRQKELLLEFESINKRDPSKHTPRAELWFEQNRLKGHEVFQRDHDDLHCELPVSFGAAALGSEIEIPTLDGVARLKVPAETQTGKVFRLRGKGIKAVRSVSHGDLLCHIVVETPTHLTQRQKELLLEFESINERDPCKHTPRAKLWRDKVKDHFSA